MLRGWTRRMLQRSKDSCELDSPQYPADMTLETAFKLTMF